MAWIDISEEANIKFYSLVDDIEILRNWFFDFWLNVSFGYIVLIFVLFAVIIVVGVLYSLRSAILNNRVVS